MKPANGRSRAVKNSDRVTYNLVQVDRKTLDDARAKCKAQNPPLPLTWQIMKLLQDWTYR